MATEESPVVGRRLPAVSFRILGRERRCAERSRGGSCSSDPAASLITTALLAKRQSGCLHTGERSASGRLERDCPSLAKRNCWRIGCFFGGSSSLLASAWRTSPRCAFVKGELWLARRPKPRGVQTNAEDPRIVHQDPLLLVLPTVALSVWRRSLHVRITARAKIAVS